MQELILISGKNNHFPSDGYWLFVVSLNLPRHVLEEWNNFTLSMNHIGIILSYQSDYRVWDKNNFNGEVTTKLAYKALVEEEVTISQNGARNFFGKIHIS